MTDRHRIWVDSGGVRIAVVRWGAADPRKPPALLLHGTGFMADIRLSKFDTNNSFEEIPISGKENLISAISKINGVEQIGSPLISAKG